MTIVIREAGPKDAKALIRLLEQLDGETQFMLYEPGERQITKEMQTKRLETMQASKHSVMLLACTDDKDLAGFIVGSGSELQRIKHSIYIVIGIQQKYTGQGIGKRLLENLENWARGRGVTRLELTVMCHNETALRLYHSAGFEVEGTKRNAIKVDGRFIDEFYMSKLLE
ncbi:GNAT family N-acetyltransferase [Paenibacillus lemnae]|uniref:GNAT family N-acetyltransferase n=1 Tax=Paenibacillus lemnae TaxID=1330551 RepID=A0A848MAA5_PAELE|nr:GNAT family N-acetyltransferase [Paenibacillus lemnae]NMO97997.1 GNAT family N-acetyltransferase [Paenibacillus lemnae]